MADYTNPPRQTPIVVPSPQYLTASPQRSWRSTGSSQRQALAQQRLAHYNAFDGPDRRQSVTSTTAPPQYQSQYQHYPDDANWSGEIGRQLEPNDPRHSQPPRSGRRQSMKVRDSGYGSGTGQTSFAQGSQASVDPRRSRTSKQNGSAVRGQSQDYHPEQYDQDRESAPYDSPGYPATQVQDYDHPKQYRQRRPSEASTLRPTQVQDYPDENHQEQGSVPYRPRSTATYPAPQGEEYPQEYAQQYDHDSVSEDTLLDYAVYYDPKTGKYYSGAGKNDKDDNYSDDGTLTPGPDQEYWFIPPMGPPVLARPPRAEDYRAQRPQTPSSSNPSIGTYISRFKRFVLKVKDLPWTLPERVTVDYYPGASKHSARHLKHRPLLVWRNPQFYPSGYHSSADGDSSTDSNSSFVMDAAYVPHAGDRAELDLGDEFDDIPRGRDSGYDSDIPREVDFGSLAQRDFRVENDRGDEEGQEWEKGQQQEEDRRRGMGNYSRGYKTGTSPYPPPVPPLRVYSSGPISSKYQPEKPALSSRSQTTGTPRPRYPDGYVAYEEHYGARQ